MPATKTNTPAPCRTVRPEDVMLSKVDFSISLQRAAYPLEGCPHRRRRRTTMQAHVFAPPNPCHLPIQRTNAVIRERDILISYVRMSWQSE
jgi:hypothetical protein